MVDGRRLLLAAIDKADALQWVEAIEVCVTMEPSPLLLHATGGTVILAGYIECQEFALEHGKYNPLQAPFRHRLGTKVDFSNKSLAAVDYGKHWTVLKNTGLVQCLDDGKPETLFDLAECQVVTVQNPKATIAGTDYSIDVETPTSRIVLRAEHPLEHSDWSLALESILKREGREAILKGNRCDECGYMALKRLIMMNSAAGNGNSLYSLPPRFNDMEDIYSVSHLGRSISHTLSTPHPRSSSIAVPRGSGNGPSPPALPPKRSATNPTSPDCGVPSPFSSSSLGADEAGDEYVAMEPLAVLTPPGASTLPHSLSSSGAGLTLRPTPSPSSQPIVVPNRRPSKQSSLLRNDSESSSWTNSPPVFGTSLGESDRFSRETLLGGPLTPLHCPPGGNPIMPRDVSYHSLHSPEQAPPLPPRNGERVVVDRGQRPSVASGNTYYARTPPSNLQRSNSSLSRMSPFTLPATHTSSGSKWTQSDGMMVSEAQRQLSQPIGMAAGLSQSSFGSDTRLETQRSNSSLDSDQGKVRIFFERLGFVECVN